MYNAIQIDRYLQQNSITIDAHLGSGSSGEVYQVSRNYQTLALKVQNFISDDEFKILQKFKSLNFTNVVNTLDVCKEDNRTLILMEKCGENLYQRICGGKTQITDFRYAFSQISNGVKELHENNIIHRDLKPENILIYPIRDRGHVQETYKIYDFGISKIDERAQTIGIGTPYYMAPEISMQSGYDNKVDIWALGCIMYEYISGRTLFSISNIQKIQDTSMQNEVKIKIKCLPIEENYKEMITQMVDVNPKNRPTIVQVIKILQARIQRSLSKKDDAQNQQPRQQILIKPELNSSQIPKGQIPVIPHNPIFNQQIQASSKLNPLQDSNSPIGRSKLQLYTQENLENLDYGLKAKISIRQNMAARAPNLSPQQFSQESTKKQLINLDYQTKMSQQSTQSSIVQNFDREDNNQAKNQPRLPLPETTKIRNNSIRIVKQQEFARTPSPKIKIINPNVCETFPSQTKQTNQQQNQTKDSAMQHRRIEFP